MFELFFVAEESSSSPVVRSSESQAGSSSAARKKKYEPNEQGRYVCTQCGRTYAAYHVIIPFLCRRFEPWSRNIWS